MVLGIKNLRDSQDPMRGSTSRSQIGFEQLPCPECMESQTQSVTSNLPIAASGDDCMGSVVLPS